MLSSYFGDTLVLAANLGTVPKARIDVRTWLSVSVFPVLTRLQDMATRILAAW